MAGQMRLDKFLTEMGRGSRSQVKEMARKGRIRVNGQTEKKSDRRLDPDRDLVELDGEPVAYARMEYYMLNKPAGVVSATEDRSYTTVTELISDAVRSDLFPVGRLDLDTEGLLLVTNDGGLAHRLLSPRRHVDKVYLARLEGEVPADAPEQFESGLILEDGTRTMPACFEKLEGDWARITLREGKFHQVKRMAEAVGCRVIYLKRVSMGPLVLDETLEPGQYRPLTKEELSALKRLQEGI